MSDFLIEYVAYCEAHGKPDRIELSVCDRNATLRGKWLPRDGADKLAKGAKPLPLSTYAPNILGEEVEASGLGIIVANPDGDIVPIAGTLKSVPWASIGGGKTKVAQVQVEMIDPDTGALSDLSQRPKLADMVAKFHAKGWHPVLTTELEFYLFKPRANESDGPTPPDRSPTTQNYDLEVLERTQGILDDVLSAFAAQGLAADTLIGEYGSGQFEINFHHTDDVMHAADTVVWCTALPVRMEWKPALWPSPMRITP